MKYKCWNCNKVFDESEMKTRTEHEEFWGAPAPIHYNICPHCGEDITDEDEYIEEEEEGNGEA